MLAPLTRLPTDHYADSGQRLDFALTPLLDVDFPGKFVGQTASSPLLRLQSDAHSAPS